MRPPLNRWSLCRLLFVLSLLAMASLPFGALAAQEAVPATATATSSNHRATSSNHRASTSGTSRTSIIYLFCFVFL